MRSKIECKYGLGMVTVFSEARSISFAAWLLGSLGGLFLPSARSAVRDNA